MPQSRRQFIKTAGVTTTVGFGGLAGCLGLGEIGGGSNNQEAPTINIGHGLAAEEPLWLMDAMPDLLEHRGEGYNANFIQFDGNTPRLQAFQAGEIQAGTITSITSFFAVDRGLPLTIVASITQETADAYATPFVAKADSDVALTEEGLNGTSIGICDFQSSCHMWSASAAQKVGLEPETDVKLVRVPFPTMPDAVNEGRVDAATMHQPFDATAVQQYGHEAKFDAVEVLGYDHDLLEVWFSTQFLNGNEEAVRLFLEDYATAVDFYENNTEEARRALLENGFVQTPEEVYLNLPRMAASARPLTDSLDKLNQRAVDLGWIEEKVDSNLLYNLDYLPDSV